MNNISVTYLVRSVPSIITIRYNCRQIEQILHCHKLAQHSTSKTVSGKFPMSHYRIIRIAQSTFHFTAWQACSIKHHLNWKQFRLLWKKICWRL